MSTLHSRSQRTAKRILEEVSEDCKQMHLDSKEDTQSLDMDTIYSSAQEMHRLAHRLNEWAGALMVECRKTEHHEYMVELYELRRESLAN